MNVATVVVNWNSWRDTVACLQSLEKLDYPQTPVVVDNGSTDGSVPRIREACPQVALIELGRNFGFGAGCNVGLRRALAMGADFIWLLNNDTLVDRTSLSSMIEAALADSGIGAIGSIIYHMDQPDRVQVWGGWRVRMLLGSVCPYTANMPLRRLDFVSGASCLLRAHAVRSVGLFDEGFFMYWEDADLGFRLRRQGWKLGVADRSRVWHKGGAAIGPRRAEADAWDNMSAARFFRRYARVPAIPLAMGGTCRIAKRLSRGEFKRIAAVISAVIKGLLQSETELSIRGSYCEPDAEHPAHQAGLGA